MTRAAAVGAFLVLAFVVSSAQWTNPRVVFPRTDPSAFRITTQSSLENAMLRFERLRTDYTRSQTDDEKDFILRMMLETLQGELNRDTNVSSVLTIETTPRDSVHGEMPVLWHSAFVVIEGKIRELGPSALAVYREMYRARANVMLEDAVRMQDRDRIQLVNRRFGLTEAGMRAAVLLARMYWAEGDVSPAARLIERALTHGDLLSEDQQAHLGAWLADCYHRMGERANLHSLMGRMAPLHRLNVTVGDSRRVLGEHFRRMYETTRDTSVDTIETQGMIWPGGNHYNTGIPQAHSDASRIAWSQTLPQLEAPRQPRRFMGYERPIVPPFLPAFDGMVTYINNGDRLLAYDLVHGGHGPSWECKPFPTYGHNWRNSEPDPSHIIPVSVYRGVVFTAIENPLTTYHHDRDPEPRFGLWPHFPKVRRALCAVDAASGRLLWKLGGEYAGSEHDTVNFSSAVVYNGVLYAIATRVEALAEVFLFALDPDTGDVLWDIRVARGQTETTMFGRPAREPFPSLPAIAGGRLFLNTNLGGLVAVDLLNRNVDWVRRYEYIPRPDTKYIDMHYRKVTWFNSPTMYAESDGRAYVVVAPTDANFLFAFDASTGDEVWRIPRESTPFFGGRALVGIRGDRVFVAGDGDGNLMQSRVVTVELSTGRALQGSRVTEPQRGAVLGLVGRPVLSGNRMLWPGQEVNRQPTYVAEIELDTLRTVEASYVPPSLGLAGFSVTSQLGVVHTIAGRDYSAGNIQLAARVDMPSLVASIRREYTERPDDAEVSLRYGMLVARTGDQAEALRALRRAFELSEVPYNPRVRNIASQALVAEHLRQADIALTRRQYQVARDHAAQAREVATSRVQLTECFLRDERALALSGDNAALMRFYRTIIETNPDFGVGENPELPARLHATASLAELLAGRAEYVEAVALFHELLTAGSRYRFKGEPLRGHALAKLREVLRTQGREPFADQEHAANALLETGDSVRLRGILEQFPLTEAADKAVRTLVEEAIRAFRYGDAMTLLNRAREEYPDRPRVIELEVLSALVNDALGERLRGRLQAMRILRAHPDGSMTYMGRQTTFKELLGGLVAGVEEASESITPTLPRQVTELWRLPWEPGDFNRLPVQPVPSPVNAVLMSERSMRDRVHKLIARRHDDGSSMWEIEAHSMVTNTLSTEQGLVVVLVNGLIAVNPEGEVRWTLTTGTSPDPVVEQQGMLLYGTRFFQTRTQTSMVRITSLDSANGTELWETDLEGSELRWMAQTPVGILALVQGARVTLHLLDAENGSIMESANLGIEGRVSCAPVLVNDRVIVASREGEVFVHDAMSLAREASFNSRVRFPTSLYPMEDDIVIVGLNGAARVKLRTGDTRWRYDLAASQALSGQALTGGTLVLASRGGTGGGNIRGISVSDGSERFSRNFPTSSNTVRMDLQGSATFRDCVALVFTEFQNNEGRTSLGGFHVLILDEDGSERMHWAHAPRASAHLAQIAAIDGYLVLACDNTTFCFGARR